MTILTIQEKNTQIQLKHSITRLGLKIMTLGLVFSTTFSAQKNAFSFFSMKNSENIFERYYSSSMKSLGPSLRGAKYSSQVGYVVEYSNSNKPAVARNLKFGESYITSLLISSLFFYCSASLAHMFGCSTHSFT